MFPRQNINQSETGIGGPKLSVELYAWGKKVTADNFHYTGETLPETKD